MSSPQVLARLLRGVQDDQREYSALQGLLGQQFQAMLRHDPERLGALAAQVEALVDGLAARRDERSALLRELVDVETGAGMIAALALLPPQLRPAHEAAWQSLEALVRDCKAANSRNCQLLMDQHSLMQRVLHGDDCLYEPA